MNKDDLHSFHREYLDHDDPESMEEDALLRHPAPPFYDDEIIGFNHKIK